MKLFKTFIMMTFVFVGIQTLALDTTQGSTAANVDSAASRGATFADFNGDGDLDVYVGNRNQQNQLWLSDGAGNFTANDIAGDTGFTHAAYSGDLDDDGDIDIYAINLGGGAQNKLWINDGAGNFTANDIAGDTNNAYGGAIGDANGDGDLDLYVTILGAQNKLWINDGAGNFTANDIAGDTGNSADAVFVDVDGDGDNDIYTGNFGQNKLWINDGSGNFTANDIALDSANAYGVATGDVDGDGDMDLYAANDGSSQNHLWVNDGSGNFTSADIAGDISTARKAAFGDLDFDGDVDLYVANNGQNFVWINDGSGNFTSDDIFGDTGDSNEVLFLDYDGDGSLDIFTFNSGAQNILWINNETAPSSGGSSGGGSGSGVRRVCKDPQASNYNPTRFGRHFQDRCTYDLDPVDNDCEGLLQDDGRDDDCEGRIEDAPVKDDDCEGRINGLGERDNDCEGRVDGDGDGVSDDLQEHVSTVVNPATGGTTTLKVVGGNCRIITDNQIVLSGSLHVADQNDAYPLGLLDFELACAEPGDSADITIIYDEGYLTNGWVYKKFNTKDELYTDITDNVVFGTMIVNGKSVTTISFTLVDGDRLMDLDGERNGIIRDPSGPAILASALPFAKIDADGMIYVCKDPRAMNYTLTKIGQHLESACDFGDGVLADLTQPSARCEEGSHVYQNLRHGARDGMYNFFTRGVVSQVAVVQKHINRILATRYDEAAGPVDGIFGWQTHLGVQRLQELLNTAIKPSPNLFIDGIVGESTRAAINATCPAVEV